MEKINSLTYLDEIRNKQSKSMLNHWQGLTLFMELPEVPLDNNFVERQLRAPVVGRKNFYGTHSDAMTKATSYFYSIVSTCKLHNVSPKRLLKDYLSLCAENQKAPPPEILEEFLPHVYANNHPESILTQQR